MKKKYDVEETWLEKWSTKGTTRTFNRKIKLNIDFSYYFTILKHKITANIVI